MKHLLSIVTITFMLCFSTSFATTKLLDKITAIVDDNIITLSQLKRVQSNVPARRSISPMIYSTEKISKAKLINIMINTHLIRDYLQTIGYVISDEQVDTQIKQTEKRLRLTRSQLLDFLKNNKMSFQEYFQLTRETIEYMSLFLPRVIVPLISISDHEIKNFYYRKNANNKTLSFKYTLNDFSFPKKKIKKRDLNNIKNILANFQITGNLPSKFQDIETSVIADVTEDGLLPSIKKVLSKANEGEFTAPITLNQDYHIFFIKKKDLVESEKFLQVKQKITQELRQEKMKTVTQAWFSRERSKHFIKINL